MKLSNYFGTNRSLLLVLFFGLTVNAGAANFPFANIAANKGLATAQATFGYMYRTGDGIGQDDDKAFEWTKQAAYRGHALSQYRLAEMYGSGTGVRQDTAKAVKWYERAANQGNVEIQFNLGNKYSKGEGVP